MAQKIHQSGPASAVYGLGLIGAVVYFIGHAASFWGGVEGTGLSPILSPSPQNG